MWDAGGTQLSLKCSYCWLRWWNRISHLEAGRPTTCVDIRHVDTNLGVTFYYFGYFSRYSHTRETSSSPFNGAMPCYACSLPARFVWSDVESSSEAVLKQFPHDEGEDARDVGEASRQCADSLWLLLIDASLMHEETSGLHIKIIILYYSYIYIYVLLYNIDLYIYSILYIIIYTHNIYICMILY
jgi:hypothetical protein